MNLPSRSAPEPAAPPLTRATWARYLPNLLVLVLFLWVAWQRWPAIRNNVSREGTGVAPVRLEGLSGTPHAIPNPAEGRVVLVFWATWCGPCRFELGRFREAVLAGEIDGGRILAVNMGEERAVVEAHAREERYPFPVLLDPRGAFSATLDVQATPTIVHIEGDGRIESMSSGIGPFSVMRATHFLAKK